jgi:hypothetical protein
VSAASIDLFLYATVREEFLPVHVHSACRSWDTTPTRVAECSP